MKSKDEPNTPKEKVETVDKKPAQKMNEEELAQVNGGAGSAPCGCASCNYDSKEKCTYYKVLGGHTKCKYN